MSIESHISTTAGAALRARAAVLLCAGVIAALAAGRARADAILIDEDGGAVYDAVLDGFPGLAPFDGEPDFGEFALAASLKAGVTEQRALAEFPLPTAATATTLESAVLVFNVDDVLSTFGPGTDFAGRAGNRLFVHVYSGDGAIALADFKQIARVPHQVDTTVFGTITDASLRQSGPLLFRVDLTGDVHALLQTGATHAGVLWRVEESPTGTSIDDLGEGSAGPPGVGGARMPELVLELRAEVSPTPTPTGTPTVAITSTSTRAPSPTGTATRTPRDTATVAPATPTATRVPGSPTPTVPFVRGDASCDGRVDGEDLRVLQAALFDPQAVASCPQADANGDGSLGSADLPALMEIAATSVAAE